MIKPERSSRVRPGERGPDHSSCKRCFSLGRFGKRWGESRCQTIAARLSCALSIGGSRAGLWLRTWENRPPAREVSAPGHDRAVQSLSMTSAPLPRVVTVSRTSRELSPPALVYMQCFASHTDTHAVPGHTQYVQLQPRSLILTQGTSAPHESGDLPHFSGPLAS